MSWFSKRVLKPVAKRVKKIKPLQIVSNALDSKAAEKVLNFLPGGEIIGKGIDKLQEWGKDGSSFLSQVADKTKKKIGESAKAASKVWTSSASARGGTIRISSRSGGSSTAGPPTGGSSSGGR